MQLKAWEDLGLNSTAPAAGEGKFSMQLQGKGKPTLWGEAYWIEQEKTPCSRVGYLESRDSTVYLNLPSIYLPVPQILLVCHLLSTYQGL